MGETAFPEIQEKSLRHSAPACGRREKSALALLGTGRAAGCSLATNGHHETGKRAPDMQRSRGRRGFPISPRTGSRDTPARCPARNCPRVPTGSGTGTPGSRFSSSAVRLRQKFAGPKGGRSRHGRTGSAPPASAWSESRVPRGSGRVGADSSAEGHVFGTPGVPCQYKPRGRTRMVPDSRNRGRRTG
jgi:hypothetical protein